MTSSLKPTIGKDLGTERTSMSRPHTDKSKSVNELQETLGKQAQSQWKCQGLILVPNNAPRIADLLSQYGDRVIDGLPKALAQVSQAQNAARAQKGGSSSESLPMNEFRREFAALPPIGSGRNCLTDAIRSRMPVLLRALFMEEKTLTMSALFEAMRPDGCSNAFYSPYLLLVAEGRILTAGNGESGGVTPYGFDLLRLAPFSIEISLRNIVERYLESSQTKAATVGVMAAIRVMLELPERVSSHRILVAAEAVGPESFHGLVGRFESAATEVGNHKKKTIQNFASSLRSLFAFGLREDQFPLYFPKFRAIDSWSALIEATFPLSTDGPTDFRTLQARQGLFVLIKAVRDELKVSHPDALTPAHIVECARRFATPERVRDSNGLARLRRVVWNAPGDWKRREIALIANTIDSLRPKPAAPYLARINAKGASLQTMEGFLECLAEHGFNATWSEFFTWYDEYSRLPWKELEQRPLEFPPRPRIRRLTDESFTNRMNATRAFLGAAKQVFPQLAATLTPTDVFGTHFKRLAQHLMAGWKEAAATARASHESSSGLRTNIIGGGMVARALYDRALLQACRSDSNSGNANLNRRFVVHEHLREDMMPIERALLKSYEYALSTAGNLDGDCRDAASGSGINTVKNLCRSIRETPFHNFQRAQEELLERLQETIAKDLGLTDEGRALCVAALIHGILISSGCRRGELCHIREGIQSHLKDGRRDVSLRAVDRKNRTEHAFILRERWVPDWLIKHYFGQVRPLLIELNPGSESEKPFLLLNPYTGHPYGCVSESLLDGSGRNSLAMRIQKQMLAKLWRKFVAKAFVARGFTVPSGAQRFCLHIVRNVAGHAVFVRDGLAQAAHFLGDKTTSVEGVYATLKGELVDTSLME